MSNAVAPPPPGKPLQPAEVFDKLAEILADILVLNKEDIQPSSKLVENLDADSIAFLELTYRLRKDFGLEVPEAKADEETLRMPLLEGLEKIEQKLGGTTLFEFMKHEAIHAEHAQQDPELRARMLELMRQTLAEPEFVETLKLSISEASEDASASRAAAFFLREARKTPELAEAVQALSTQDAELARLLEGLDQLAEAEIARAGAPKQMDLISLWFDAAGTSSARKRMTEIKVKQLAGLMATGVPRGYSPDASVASLQLRDLFSFITVDAYVRYVIYLAASQERIRAMGGADAMNAELAARLRGESPRVTK
jgi:acyl carrier protein